MKRTNITQTKVNFKSEQSTRLFKASYLFLALLLTAWQTYAQQNTIVDEKGEAYLFYKNDYPKGSDTFWGDNGLAANGIASNSKHGKPSNPVWYISSMERNYNGTTGSEWVLFKVPFDFDLNTENVGFPNGRVLRLRSKQFTGSHSLTNYRHIGDIDYVKHGSREFIVAPLYGDGVSAAIGFFNASNLSFHHVALIPYLGLNETGWCAVKSENGEDYIYTSVHNPTVINKYKINWTKILSKKSKGLEFEESIPLPQVIYNMQGGEFSPSGDLLYISSGLMDCNPLGGMFGGASSHKRDGIHVFKYVNGVYKLVEHSINTENDDPSGCFDFSYKNDGCYELEPEGLAIVDLNDGSAPGVRGQLHVLLDDHDNNGFPFYAGGGKINLKHYRSFKCPNDIEVIGTTAQGEPSTNPTITNFLERGTPIGNTGMQSFNGCATVSNDAPAIFPPGKTEVTFTVHDRNFKVQCRANVKIINKHDECDDALKIYGCDKIVTNNLCAGKSINIPPMPGYGGAIKDVWYLITPVKNFSIETKQVNGGITNTVMQLFEGTCGNLIPLAIDDTSGDGEHSKITINNYQGTKPLYVRITEHGANNYGEFGIYYKKIAPGSVLFNQTNFISGDGNGIHDYDAHYGDVDGNGTEDLIFIGHGWNGQPGMHIRVKFSNGDGTYTATSQIFSDGIHTLANPVLTGDFNGDGKTDIATVFKSPTSGGLVIRTKISIGNGQFTPYNDYIGDGAAIFTYPTLTGDINGDGKTDIIFVGQNWSGNGLNIRVKISNGDGTFTAYSQVLPDGAGVHTFPTLIGDINGDGKDDLIFTGYGWNNHDGLQIRVKLSNGDGTFTATSQKFNDKEYVLDNPVLVGHFNNDSLADLAFVFKSPSTGGLVIRTKISNGNGQFTSYEEYQGDGVNIFENNPMACDANGDGMDDIVFAGQNWKGCGLNIRVKLSNGDGTWCAQYQTLGDGSGVHKYPMMPLDANGDGKCDFVFHGQDWSSPGLNIRTKFSLVTTCSSNVNNQNRLTTNYTVFPNPSNSFVSITDETNSGGKLSIQLLSQAGLVLFKNDNYNQGDQLDISKYKTGFYFIEIVNTETGEKSTQKIIKVE